MNIFRSRPIRLLAFSLAWPLAALLGACSVDSTTAVPSDNSGTIYNFSGLYTRTDSNGVQQVLVFPTNKQTGVDLTWMRVLQYGNVLEAYDNAGQNWSGSISGLQEATASFSLQGQTTAGQAVEITGTMDYQDQRSFMNAAWIEPSFAGSILAQATVSPAATNAPGGGSVSISPGSAVITVNGSRAFTASGGSGTYTWTQSNSARGTLSSTTGTTITYEWKSSGPDVLTVTSGGSSDSAAITCQ